MKPGTVYIVGAGPGDPGLITVKGQARLRECDVVVHDRLIDHALLREARAGAEIIDVGKRPGESHRIQASIHSLLVARARLGRSVCRLKGGDPFVFGRGGEEAQALAQAGIPFEIVPGVSSVSAVPAAAGIPLTHRVRSHAFMVVTACRAAGGDADWSIAADFVRAGGTLVVLMGLARVGAIADALGAGGCASSTPAAVISSGTFPSQEKRIGTLANIAERAGGLRPPALILVGPVVLLDISGVESGLTSFEQPVGTTFTPGERK